MEKNYICNNCMRHGVPPLCENPALINKQLKNAKLIVVKLLKKF